MRNFNFFPLKLETATASAFVLTFAVTFAITFVIGCGPASSTGPLNVNSVDGQQMNDFGVASIPTPAGWEPNRSDGNTVLILTRSGANRQAPEEMISFDVGRALVADAEGTARSLAAKFGGTIKKLAFKIDGSDAYRVSIPPSYDRLMPRECLVVHSADKACIVFGASKKQADLWPTLEGISKAWKWN
jgi:hypothetical protein